MNTLKPTSSHLILMETISEIHQKISIYISWYNFFAKNKQQVGQLLAENDKKNNINQLSNLINKLFELDNFEPQSWFFDIRSQVIDILAKKLLFATTHCAEAVCDLLTVIDALPTQQKVKALSAGNKDGMNAYMNAIYYQPAAIADLVAFTDALPQQHLAKILTLTDDDSWNSLMYKVRYEPQLISSVLKTIATLSKQQQYQIFSQVNDENWNVLMLAIYYHPSIVPEILEAITPLAPKQQVKIISQIDKEGFTPLTLAIENQGMAINYLLSAIASLQQQTGLTTLRLTQPAVLHQLSIDIQRLVTHALTLQSNDLLVSILTTLSRESLSDIIQSILVHPQENVNHEKLAMLYAWQHQLLIVGDDWGLKHFYYQYCYEHYHNKLKQRQSKLTNLTQLSLNINNNDSENSMIRINPQESLLKLGKQCFPNLNLKETYQALIQELGRRLILLEGNDAALSDPNARTTFIPNIQQNTANPVDENNTPMSEKRRNIARLHTALRLLKKDAFQGYDPYFGVDEDCFDNHVAYLYAICQNQAIDSFDTLLTALVDIRRAHNPDKAIYAKSPIDRCSCGSGSRGRLHQAMLIYSQLQQAQLKQQSTEQTQLMPFSLIEVRGMVQQQLQQALGNMTRNFINHPSALAYIILFMQFNALYIPDDEDEQEQALYDKLKSLAHEAITTLTNQYLDIDCLASNAIRLFNTNFKPDSEFSSQLTEFTQAIKSQLEAITGLGVITSDKQTDRESFYYHFMSENLPLILTNYLLTIDNNEETQLTVAEVVAIIRADELPLQIKTTFLKQLNLEVHNAIKSYLAQGLINNLNTLTKRISQFNQSQLIASADKVFNEIASELLASQNYSYYLRLANFTQQHSIKLTIDAKKQNKEPHDAVESHMNVLRKRSWLNAVSKQHSPAFNQLKTMSLQGNAYASFALARLYQDGRAIHRNERHCDLTKSKLYALLAINQSKRLQWSPLLQQVTLWCADKFPLITTIKGLHDELWLKALNSDNQNEFNYWSDLIVIIIKSIDDSSLFRKDNSDAGIELESLLLKLTSELDTHQGKVLITLYDKLSNENCCIHFPDNSFYGYDPQIDLKVKMYQQQITTYLQLIAAEGEVSLEKILSECSESLQVSQQQLVERIKSIYRQINKTNTQASIATMLQAIAAEENISVTINDRANLSPLNETITRHEKILMVLQISHKPSEIIQLLRVNFDISEEQAYQWILSEAGQTSVNYDESPLANSSTDIASINDENPHVFFYQKPPVQLIAECIKTLTNNSFK